MKASDLFVKCLENEGITHIFGVPGEENADFVMSLEGSSINFVLTRHEQGAAFMADVYGRLTGNPAVALGTLGPGATNLLTGVANANMDRSPCFVITGQGETGRLHKESHQVMDVVEMYKPVTKWAATIAYANAIPEMVRKGVRIARMEKPGAILLELPEDVAQEETTTSPLEVRRFRRPDPDPKVINKAFKLLTQAKRPIILAGNGTLRKRASEQLRRFCRMTGIGAMSTFMGKGCVDMDEPHCLFTVGLQSKDLTARAIEESDLVIAIGYDMVEYSPELWNKSGQQNIIHIDFEPAEIDAKYHPRVEIVGDIASAIAHLIAKVGTYEKSFTFELDYQKDLRQRMTDDFLSHKDDVTEGSIRPQKMLSDLREVMGPKDILLSDVGAHKMWIARNYQCHEPNTCLIPNGFCSMGFALPGAIAAKIVHPERNIVAISGDGGFLMNCQEMETAARLGTNIVAIVWEDGGYGLISWKQDTQFGHHTPLEFSNPDWVQMAQSFGWEGVRIENSVDLKPALQQSFKNTKPTLIVLPIDYRENPILTKRLGEIAASI